LGWNPIANAMPQAMLGDFMAAIEQGAVEEVRLMARHIDVLTQCCSPPKPAEHVA
jgi:hypothetical protein